MEIIEYTYQRLKRNGSQKRTPSITNGQNRNLSVGTATIIQIATVKENKPIMSGAPRSVGNHKDGNEAAIRNHTAKLFLFISALNAIVFINLEKIKHTGIKYKTTIEEIYTMRVVPNIIPLGINNATGLAL